MELKKEGFKDQRAIVLPHAMKELLKSDEMTFLLYITDIGYYPNAVGHYRSRHNGADQHILIYCTEGKGWVSQNGTRHGVNEGEFFIIEAKNPHSYGASTEKPWSIYWVHFTGSKSHLFQTIYNKVLHINQALDARKEEQLKMFEEIF